MLLPILRKSVVNWEIMKFHRKFGRPALSGFLLAFLLLTVALKEWAQDRPASSTVLKAGRPVTRSMAGKDLHTYTVHLKKGMYLGLAVEQRDVDVFTEVFDPNSKSLGKFDAPTSERGTEMVRIGADVTGDYRINVSTSSELAGPGEYRLEITGLRQINERDASVLKAVGFQQEAIRLRLNPETRKDAIPVYDSAVQIWRELGLAADEANTLRSIAFVYQRADQIDKAREYFGKALKIWERIGDARSAAFTHVIYGVYSRKQNDFQAALEHDLRARQLWLKADDKPEQTHNLVQIGNDHLSLGHKAEALEYFQKALDLVRRIGRKSIEALVLSEYGDAKAKLGNKAEALAMYRQSAALWKSFRQDKIAADVEEKIVKLSAN